MLANKFVIWIAIDSTEGKKLHKFKKSSEYDQANPQSNITDQPRAPADVHSKEMVLMLLIRCCFLLPLWGSMLVPCFCLCIALCPF